MSQHAAMTPKQAVQTPGYAWVVLFAVYMATLAAPLNQMKVPPVMPILRESFDLGYSGAGMLMSIFSILGFVLAIPAGFILQRIGIKKTGLISVAAVLLGSVLGALSGTTVMLFASRFVEGAGMGLIMVAAPAALSLWFPAERRGLPMGLWASCVGIGNIAALNLAPALAAASGWRAVWWAGAIVAALAFVLFIVLFRLPREGEVSGMEPPVSSKSGPEEPSGVRAVMTNGSNWMISIAFMVFNLVVMAISTFYPDYLNTVRNYSLARASFITSLIMLVAIFAGPLGGYVSDRLGKRKVLIVYPFIMMALVFLFPFTATGWMIPALMIFFGIVAGPIAPVSLAAVPEIMPSPKLVGVGLGVVILGQNVGMLIGPTLFGFLVEQTSWAMAGYLMIPICAVAILCASLAKIR